MSTVYWPGRSLCSTPVDCFSLLYGKMIAFHSKVIALHGRMIALHSGKNCDVIAMYSDSCLCGAVGGCAVTWVSEWVTVLQQVSLFCAVTNKSTIISQIMTLLHVFTISCHPQTACNQYLAKLHQCFIL
jgi:hypothetical protein